MENTTSCVKDIRDSRIEEDEIMNLHDMVSFFFTNVLTKETLEVIGKCLKENETSRVYQICSGGHYGSVLICFVYNIIHV